MTSDILFQLAHIRTSQIVEHIVPYFDELDANSAFEKLKATFPELSELAWEEIKREIMFAE